MTSEHKEMTPQSKSRFIVTFSPHFQKDVMRELAIVDTAIKPIIDFGSGKALVSSVLEGAVYSQRLVQQDPIFIKHIMPVMGEGKVVNDLEIDKKAILAVVDRVAATMAEEKFAVQCRIISGGKGGLVYSSKDIEVFVGEEYCNRGNTPSFSDSVILNDDIKIISILINGDDYYVGYSTSGDNLNFHCDEHRVCSKTARAICRSENKLKEALARFKIVLSGEGAALDIGAAPGGWTKVLADYGYEVVAVDPGDLHPFLRDNPKIKHHKTQVEKLDFKEHFDVVTNDMNIGPQETSAVMVGLAPTLKSGGIAIVTLKLPMRAKTSIDESVRILEKVYDIVGIKSLFHNRQEVTVVLRKK